MRKMKIQGQIIDFVDVDEPAQENIYDKLVKLRDSPETDEAIKLIICYVIGEK